MLEVKRLEVEYLDTPEFIDFANKSRTTPQPGRNCNFDYSIDMMIARVKKEIGLAEIPKYAYGLFIDNVLKSVTSITEINDFAYYIDHFAPICSNDYITEYDQLIAYIIDDMISKNFKVAYAYSSKDFYEQWSSGLSDDFISKNRITVLETVPVNGIIREPLIAKRNPYYNKQIIPSIHGDVEPSSIHPSMEVDSVVLHINYQF